MIYWYEISTIMWHKLIIVEPVAKVFLDYTY